MFCHITARCKLFYQNKRKSWFEVVLTVSSSLDLVVFFHIWFWFWSVFHIIFLWLATCFTTQVNVSHSHFQYHPVVFVDEGHIRNRHCSYPRHCRERISWFNGEYASNLVRNLRRDFKTSKHIGDDREGSRRVGYFETEDHKRYVGKNIAGENSKRVRIVYKYDIKAIVSAYPV